MKMFAKLFGQAVQSNNIAEIKHLIHQYINKSSKTSINPLVAIEHRNLDAVKLIVKMNPLTIRSKKNQMDPIAAAVFNGWDVSGLRWLIRKLRTVPKPNVLHAAVILRKRSLLRLFIEEFKMSPTAGNIFGRTPLMLAIQMKRKCCADYLKSRCG